MDTRIGYTKIEGKEKCFLTPHVMSPLVLCNVLVTFSDLSSDSVQYGFLVHNIELADASQISEEMKR